MITAEHEETTLPIILLPPSTTSARYRNGSTMDNGNVMDAAANTWVRKKYPEKYDVIDNSSVGNAMDDDYSSNGNEDEQGYGAGNPVNAAVSASQVRPYGSGLSNLGNTCFMNSTLQCLAHTEPLQRYFLTGEYLNDLNRDNPLGTGGELAIQFAKLLAEMYVVEPPRPSYSASTRTTRYSSYASPEYLASHVHVVVPRDFKATLGRHAEQFMGYDQHDSQELATYLLDALHEDTNRVTIKPYVEKPEQGEHETDDEAAQKAWTLHLKREDSRVLENFMGLVKSRVECCEEGCGRVSTTFDPVMYLSVPIPGSSERTIQVTYVPLEPLERPKSLSIVILKTAKVEDLIKKVRAQIRDIYPSLTPSSTSPALEDICTTDVWHNNVHTWMSYTDEVEKIRDEDTTFIYELQPLREIRDRFEEKQKLSNSESSTDVDDVEQLGIGSPNRPKYYQLDIGTLTQLNKADSWSGRMSTYLASELSFVNAFHHKKGNTSDRVKIYNNLVTFIDECYQAIEESTLSEENTATGQKRTREENEWQTVRVSPEDSDLKAIVERCNSQTMFKSVRSRYDLAVLEFLAGKMRKEIIELDNRRKELNPNGIVIEICMRKVQTYYGEKPTDNIVVPFVLRIPSDMTVYGLRQELAKRLTRSLRTLSGRTRSSSLSTGQATSEVATNVVAPTSYSEAEERNDTEADDVSGEEFLVIRQIPLSYEQNSYSHNRHTNRSYQMGSLSASSCVTDGSRPVAIASPLDEEEKAFVSDYIGNHGKVYLEWTPELERSFDCAEYENVDYQLDTSNRSTSKNKTKTVIDCIDKFCQKEQLEETEQWYCNKCQKHVRAWKQFHIYKSPPHLIVHLKRFQYSPTTHRRNKINVLIDFPVTGLDLTGHVSHWSEADNDKPIYDCYAVTNHYGGLGGGHYTAYALNPNGAWSLYDDSRITMQIDPKEVVSPAAYVLYYRRRDVPTNFPISYGPQMTIIPHDVVGTSLAVATTTPALIQNDPESRSHTTPSSDESSTTCSNAAMIGDEEDHTMNDVAENDSTVDDNDESADSNNNDTANNNVSSSRATSPMGSITENHYGDIDDNPPSVFVVEVEQDYDNDSHPNDVGDGTQTAKKTKDAKNRNHRNATSILPLQ